MVVPVMEFKSYFLIVDCKKEVYEDKRNRAKYIWDGWADKAGERVKLTLLNQSQR
jgi:hypothetical protein